MEPTTIHTASNRGLLQGASPSMLAVCLMLAMHASDARAQLREATSETAAAQAVRLNATTASDREMLDRADQSVRQAEASLKEVFVAYKIRHDAEQWRLGLPLVTSTANGMGLAYDMAGKSMMAQWKHSVTTSHGGSLDYRAFVGETGQMAVVVNRRF